MEKISITGGARVGLTNVTWPFVTLNITKDRLDLNGTIVGDLVFRPEDIISIEPYFIIPIIGQGIKINHRIPNYNDKVIFWTFKKPNVLIKRIKQAGF